MRNASVFGDLHARNLLDEVFEHVVVRNLEGGGGEGHGIPFHLYGITPVGHLCGIELLQIGAYAQDSEIDIRVFDFEFLDKRLVTHQLRLEGVIARFEICELHTSVLLRERVCQSLGILVSRLGNGGGCK